MDDADDGMRLTVERNGPPHDPGIGSKSAAPHAFADDHDARGARLVIASRERPTAHRRNTQHIEEVGRHECGVERLWLAAAARQVHTRPGIDRHVLEHMILRPPIQVVRWRHRKRGAAGKLFLRWRVPHAHDARGVGEWQGAENDGIHDTEDRGVGADTQCEDHDRGQ